MQNCTVESTRRALHLAASTRCPRNLERLAQLVRLRAESAALLGYASHAERALDVKMAATPAATHAFLDGIAGKLESRLAADLAELRALKAKLGGGDGAERVRPWDVAYLAAEMKRALGVDNERIKTYFPAAHVVPTAVALVASLLGCAATRVSEAASPWHASCEVYAVTAAGGGGGGALVGHVILDLAARPNKFGHQMVVPLRPALADATPVCCVLGNLGDETGLLRFREVETLLHELGHVFHALCGERGAAVVGWAWPIVPWPGGVAMDFLEVPSMLMQQFVFAPAALARLSKRASDGAMLPASDVAKLIDSKTLLAGYGNARFIAMAKYDLHMHGEAAPADAEALAALWHTLYAERVGLDVDESVATHFCTAWCVNRLLLFKTDQPGHLSGAPPPYCSSSSSYRFALTPTRLPALAATGPACPRAP